MKAVPMPLYRLTTPGLPDEILAAERLVVEGVHTTLYGTALVIGRPRELVVRRCLAHVRVEVVEGERETSRADWLLSRLSTSAAAGEPARRQAGR